MAIFNMIGGGTGGSLIDAELVYTTTANYSAQYTLIPVSYPNLTPSSDYVYAMDVQLETEISGSTDTVLRRFFGIIGSNVTNKFVSVFAFGVAYLLGNAYTNNPCVARTSEAFYAEPAGRKPVLRFYMGTGTSSYAQVVANTTYRVDFYKLTLP